MNKPIELDDNNFDQNVTGSKMPVLVDFWAPWCAPCRMVAPVVEELAEEYSSRISFAKVNVDEGQRVAAKYGIRSIPTLLLFNDGKPIHQIVGYKPKEKLKQSLDEALT